MSTLIFLPGTIVAVSNQKRSFRNIVPDKNYNRRVFTLKRLVCICSCKYANWSNCILAYALLFQVQFCEQQEQCHPHSYICVFFSVDSRSFLYLLNKIAPIPDPGGTLWINCIQELKIALTFTLYSLFISCNSFKDVETISTALTYRVIVSDQFRVIFFKKWINSSWFTWVWKIFFI